MFGCIVFGSFMLCNTGCVKELMPLPAPTPVYSDLGLVKDIDGRSHKTVKIGNQWWMAENLSTTHYNDSTPIPLVNMGANSEWESLTEGAYCIQDGGNKYGLLYNWYAVNSDKKIAPKGWHVATDDDWKELEQFLGMDDNEASQLLWRGNDIGNKLKVDLPANSVSYFYWLSYTDLVYPNNISGFYALPGGCRLPGGAQGQPNSYIGAGAGFCTGFWWTGSQDSINIDQAWYRYLDYKEPGVFRYYGSKNYGFSVRCVKDEE